MIRAGMTGMYAPLMSRLAMLGDAVAPSEGAG